MLRRLKVSSRTPGCWLLWLLVVMSSASCRKLPSTQLLVVIDSNLSSVHRVQNVRVLLQTPDGQPLSERVFDLAPTGPVSIPFSFGVVPRADDGSRRVRVIAQARNGGQTVLVQRSALTGFLGGRVLRLPLYLPDICVGLECPVGTTCRGDARVCVSDEVEPSLLSEVQADQAGAELDGGTSLPLRDAAVVSEGIVRDIPPTPVDADGGTTLMDAGEVSTDAGTDGAPSLLRPVWPLSAGRVTRRQPLLLWTGDGGGRTLVEFCRNRTCSAGDGGVPGVIMSFITDSNSGTAPTPLPEHATVFWRVTPVNSAGIAIGRPSPVWYFAPPSVRGRSPATRAISRRPTSTVTGLRTSGTGSTQRRANFDG